MTRTTQEPQEKKQKTRLRTQKVTPPVFLFGVAVNTGSHFLFFSQKKYFLDLHLFICRNKMSSRGKGSRGSGSSAGSGKGGVGSSGGSGKGGGSGFIIPRRKKFDWSEWRAQHFHLWNCASCGYSKYQCKCSLLEGLSEVPIKDIRELIVEFIEIDCACFNCGENNVSRKQERGEGNICGQCLLEDYDGCGRF